jgi:hypothetical protein
MVSVAELELVAVAVAVLDMVLVAAAPTGMGGAVRNRVR